MKDNLQRARDFETKYLPHLLDDKNVELFKRHRVYSLTELAARCETLLENYCKTARIEAKTMLTMVRRELLPAITGAAARQAANALALRSLSPTLGCACVSARAERLSALADEIDSQADTIETVAGEISQIASAPLQAAAVRDRLLPAMRRLRAACDAAESLVPADEWPFPTYAELLFSV